jgi:hypothetical protein
VTGRYWLMTLIGLLVAGASIVALDWGLYHLVRTGTCASGGPYVSARPCPPGTGGHIMAVVGGVFAGLIGIGIYAARGKGGRPSRIGLGLLMWMLLFVTIALSVAWAAFGPANNDDSAARGVAIGFLLTFLPLGLAPLAFAGRVGKKQKLAAQLLATGKRCTGEVVSVEDTGITINDNPRVKITVRAEPPGESPFLIEKTATVSRVSIPRRGDRCTVFYDPADRENRNGITFDPVPGMDTGVPAAAAAAAGVPGVQADDDDDEDPLAKIERLGQLRDRGLITQEEFDEQKRRLLGEV